MNIPPGSRSKVFLVPWGGAFTTPPRPLLLHHRRPLGSLYQWSDTACALVWLLMQPAALTRAVICAPACSNTVCSHCSHLYEPPRFVRLHSGARGPRFRYSRPRTEQPGTWLLMCLLCAKWSLWLPGMDCSALADAASCLPVVVPASVFVCLPFFTPGRGETLKPITQMRGLRATDSPGLEPPGPSCWPVASQA